MAKRSSPLSTSRRPTKFGMFYPRGYVIVAFKNEEDADAVRQRLIDGGYDEEDVLRMDTSRVLEGSTGDLEHLHPLIKALGSETDLMEGHQAGAAAGQAFLLAYAPSDLDAERVDERGTPSRVSHGAEVRPLLLHRAVNRTDSGG